MVKINRIGISDFRGIRNLELDFSGSGNLVVLAGLNGCGKTSVLEACQLALEQDGLLQREIPQNQEFCLEMEVSHAGHSFLLRRSYVGGGTYGMRADGEEFDFKKESAAYLGPYSVFSFPSWRMPKLVGSLGMSVGRGKKPGKTDSANVLWRLKQRLINLKGMRGFAGSLQSERGGAPSSNDVFQRLNDAWKMFYPDGDRFFEAELVSGDGNNSDLANVNFGVRDAEDDIAFDVFLRNVTGSFHVPVDMLSSGEIEILCLLGVLICEPKPYDIVFVDEPELHLNTQWHRTILPALLRVSPATQFVVATHSPEIWDQAYTTQRFMLPRLGGLK